MQQKIPTSALFGPTSSQQDARLNIKPISCVNYSLHLLRIDFYRHKYVDSPGKINLKKKKGLLKEVTFSSVCCWKKVLGQVPHTGRSFLCETKVTLQSITIFSFCFKKGHSYEQCFKGCPYSQGMKSKVTFLFLFFNRRKIMHNYYRV